MKIQRSTEPQESLSNLAVLLFALGALLISSGASLAQTGDAAPGYLTVSDVPHGTVSRVDYDSSALGTERELVVYTPPGYARDTRRYPVLYLLHGAGSDQSSWTERGRAHVIFDNLIAEGRMEPSIVVMPFGYAFQREPGAGRGDAAENKRQREGFARDLLEDVIPFVERTYAVSTARRDRAIAGLSLGGGQSLGIGLGNLEVFSHVAAFSPAMGAANNPETGGVDFDRILEDAAGVNGSLDLLWIGCGFEDTLFDSNREFAGLLVENGIEHVFRVTDGGHTYPVWQRYLYEVAPLLFRAEGLPEPARVE
jgi:enterochelin esterase-like enzyme